MRARLRHPRYPGFTVALLVSALVLRMLVPAGYMPAPVSDGWPVQLCPDNLPAAVVQALLGPQHQHHHHHGGEVSGGDELAMPEQCALGAGFALASIHDIRAPATALSLLPVVPVVDAIAPPRLVFVYPGFRSRAPPFLLS